MTVRFVLVQSVAMRIEYKKGKIEGILSTGIHLRKAADLKFMKHMGK